MQVEICSFLDILGRADSQFVVPVFQRVYSWKKQECVTLFEDVIASGKTGRKHFLGTFLYAEGDREPDGTSTLQIVDGQQRITTVSLMLLAFAKTMQLGGDLETSSEIMQKYLLCGDERKPKLVLTSIDEDMMAYLLGLQDEPEDIALRLKEILDLCLDLLARDDELPKTFLQGLKLLDVMSIELSGVDSPQDVFESLNSKGKRLDVEDLVRNMMLYETKKKGEDALSLYNDEWMPLEEKVLEAHGIELEDVICSWIASRHPSVFLDSKSEVFPLFKSDIAKRFHSDWSLAIEDLSDYANHFISDDQWRHKQMTELDRWLQGKPRGLVSSRKMFGD